MELLKLLKNILFLLLIDNQFNSCFFSFRYNTWIRVIVNVGLPLDCLHV